jgi:hypothetical protein
MFENENSVRYLSSFELHRQAAIERNLLIQACVRAAARALATWVRVLFVRSTRLVHTSPPNDAGARLCASSSGSTTVC